VEKKTDEEGNKIRMKKIISITLSLFLIVANISSIALADDESQAGNIELRGIVTDEQNAFIVAAPVIIEDAQGQKVTATTDEKGRYRFANLKPGIYTLIVEIDGFAKFTQQLDIKRNLDFNVPLKVFIAEQVEVKNDSSAISAEPDKNLSATILSPKELEALPDDPDELLDTLKQMAGAAGGADSSVYVNGFGERGRIPPKESIQQIKINSNPFSPEFSEPGFTRIEIITKPGSDTFHAGFRFNFNDDFLNARNATASFKAPTQTRSYSGNFSGPLIRNRWGFFVDIDRRELDDNAFVNAITLPTETLVPTPFSTTVLVPSRNTNFSVRSEYLLSKKHTMGVQYRYSENTRSNQGIGTFDLPERAATSSNSDNTLRFSLTTIATEHAVNEFRFQINRRKSGSSALSTAPAVFVSEAFNFGGNQGQLFSNNTTEGLEATDDITYTFGKHTIKTGMRAEATKLGNLSRSNFGGSFTFGSDFVRDAQGFILDASGNIVRDPNGRPIDIANPGTPAVISSLDLYRNVLTGVPGYRPSQFNINLGDPFIGFTQWEFGWYVQDDWRISPKFSLSYGVRQEMQTHLQDKLNIAPRFSLAWVPDKAKKSTVRVGGGIFYSRLDTNITSQTIRTDGIHQQNFVLARPDFFLNIPTSFDNVVRPSIYVKDEQLNAPYQMLSTVSYERQLPWKLFGAVAYTWSRGVHLLRTRNINAPVDGIKPQPDQGPLFVYESTGKSNRNEVRFNVRTGFSQRFTLFGNYTLAHTKSDVDGVASPSDPYNLAIDYGRSSNDVRHNIFVGGSITTFWNIRLNPFVNISSGRPFNITTGQDINGDSVFTDRPAFASAGDPGAKITPYGIFNPNPLSGDEIIPRNFGDGPGQINVSMGISRTFGFGPAIGNFPGMSAAGGNGGNNNRGGNNQQGGNQQGGNQGNRGNRGGNNQQGGNQNSAMGQAMNQIGSAMARGGGPGGPGGGGQGGGGFGGGGMMRGGGPGGFGGTRTKYNLTVDLRANNLLNHTNFFNYNGVLTSPFFGRANVASQPRRIELSLRFGF
jgi:hypothetical protein